MSEENPYYIYILLDPRKLGSYIINEHFSLLYEPFYVGLSRNKNRFKEHIREARNSKKNTLKLNKIRKILSYGHNPIEFIIFSNLSKEQAIDLEILLIAHVGRIDLDTGILTNGTKGGEGSTGWSKERKEKIKGDNNPSKNSEVRKKISDKLMGHVGYFKDKKLSKSHKCNISNSLLGRKQSTKHIENNRKSHLGYKKSKIELENCKRAQKERANKLDYIAPSSKPVMVYGIKYDNIKTAMEFTKETRYFLMKKIKMSVVGFKLLSKGE